MPVRTSNQGIRFEWDAKKAAANRTKHGVDFEQACEAFFDPFLRAVDAGFEVAESREAILGLDPRLAAPLRRLRRASRRLPDHLGPACDPT